ncbi:YbjN domain-containing protein [Azospirillum sp. A39]|uniref:YbjN domain-containing protein n=1 Tax=Azospirillum sp. A39 TaxID=3462279 RepID=UPI004045DA59
MSALAVDTPVVIHNPLDIVEEIVTANEWPFERTSEEELVVEIGGRWCDYRLYFVWQSDVSAMQFSCQFDMKVQSARRQSVHDLLAEVNARLWLGHFDVCTEEHTPMFRQTTLLRGSRGATVEQLEDLVEIALSECERFYPAFQFVIWGGKSAADAVSAAILDTQGEA